jgi:hypothetical protein
MKRFLLLGLDFALCLALLGCSRGVSLRGSEASIKKRMEQLTPIGSSYEAALGKLTQKFGRVQANERTGFLLQEGAHQEVVGVKSIRVHLGSYYHFPLGSTSVDAFWGFDDQGKLIKVWIWKTTDAP